MITSPLHYQTSSYYVIMDSLRWQVPILRGIVYSYKSSKQVMRSEMDLEESPLAKSCRLGYLRVRSTRLIPNYIPLLSCAMSFRAE